MARWVKVLGLSSVPTHNIKEEERAPCGHSDLTCVVWPSHTHIVDFLFNVQL